MNAVESAAVTRSRTLEARRALGAADRARLSTELVERFWQGWRARAGDRSLQGFKVALYRAMNDEADLRALEPELVRRGATLYFPRVVDRVTCRLELVEAGAGETRGWVKSSYGVIEPPADAPIAEPMKLDLIFVPGVAFGMQGERIGMGVGHYDRYLTRAKTALRVALAFDCQLYARVEQADWDQSLHWILTEKREARTPAFTDWLSRRSA